MALTASQVLTRAGDLIQDATNVRWSAAELLRWLNDGRREIAITRPDIYAVVAVVTLAAGTRQTVPTDSSRFLDAYRNMDATGQIPGRSVRLVKREHMDEYSPDWHSATAGVTQDFMFDERVPTAFFVYPPALAGAKLEIAYAQAPADVVEGDTLTQEGIYAGALVDYICYRAFLKDATHAGNAQRSASAYAQFAAAIGAGDGRDLTSSPNTSHTDGTPATSGG